LKRFALFVIGVLALLNLYGAARIFARAPWMLDHLGAASLCAAAFFLLQLAGPFGDRVLFTRIRRQSAAHRMVRVIDWASYLAFGVLSVLVAYELVLDLVTLPWKWLAPPPDPRAFDRRVLEILGAAVGATVIVGVWQARRRPGVRRVDIPLRGLPARFEGFRIAQVSDLHVGPTITRARTREVVDCVNALQPDLVALTGDFADGTVRDLASDMAPIADLRAPQGLFFVTGNHEYFWNAGEWMAEFRRLGARVLANEHVLIERGGESILLAGITDLSATHLGYPHAPDPQRALAGAPAGLTRIVLAHQPASYPLTQAAGFDLQLSGHTHAGQYFPFSLLIRYFQRYYKGLNRHEQMWIYVNRGTGYWGPPLRTGVPAEVTLITLRREAAAAIA
jgi:predicted MPP superfamily phosphohydrolase